MKRFILTAITAVILSIGSFSAVSAQMSEPESAQKVQACVAEAAEVLEISYSEAYVMYEQGEIYLEDRGNDTLIKSSGGGHTIAILENIF